MKNELNLTPELLEKAKSAPSAAALLTMAQESGIEMTAEQAAEDYAQLHPEEGALSDAELDNVTGGGCGNSQSTLDMQIDYLGRNYCSKDRRCAAVRENDIYVKSQLRGTPSRGKLCRSCPFMDTVNAYFRSKGWPEFSKDTDGY